MKRTKAMGQISPYLLTTVCYSGCTHLNVMKDMAANESCIVKEVITENSEASRPATMSERVMVGRRGVDMDLTQVYQMSLLIRSQSVTCILHLVRSRHDGREKRK